MKNLIIIGAGNFAKILYEYALVSPDCNVKWKVKGFIDPDIHSLDNDPELPQVLSSVEDYDVCEDDLFICSYVNPNDREKSINIIKSRGGKFVNLIHPTANINRRSVLGEGIFIGAFTTLSVNTVINDHVIIQDHCNIGHDSSIGSFSHLYVRSTVCGKNNIGNKVALYTCSVIYPLIKVCDSSIVGAGSVVMRTVKEGTTVIGNPAKKME